MLFKTKQKHKQCNTVLLPNASLSLAFCVSSLKNARGRHEIFYILSKNLIFRFQFQVFFFDSIYPCREICKDKWKFLATDFIKTTDYSFNQKLSHMKAHYEGNSSSPHWYIKHVIHPMITLSTLLICAETF